MTTPHIDTRSITTRLADDGEHIIIERSLDRRVSPAKWRSKNRRRRLNPDEVAFYRRIVGERAWTEATSERTASAALSLGATWLPGQAVIP